MLLRLGENVFGRDDSSMAFVSREAVFVVYSPSRYTAGMGEGARRLLLPRASGLWSAGMSRYLPQLARSSQPLRRSDSIMLSTTLELAPSSLNVFTRNAHSGRVQLSASTTRLSCGAGTRTGLGAILFSFTKPVWKRVLMKRVTLRACEP